MTWRAPSRGVLRQWRTAARVGACAGVVLAFVLAAALVNGAGPALSSAVPATAVVVFKDGDRLRGTIVASSETDITFASSRAGMLTISRIDILRVEEAEDAGRGEEVAPQGDGDPVVDDEPTDVETGGVLRWLRKWKAGLAVSAEGKREGDQRSSFMVEARVGRTWSADEVRLGARYEFAREGERTTDDLIELDGYARHDFHNRWFVLYSPELDWNRGYIHRGSPLEYVWLQQEIGAGLNAIDRSGLMLRFGVAENLFNVWTIDRDVRVSTNTESLFTECEWQLPWAVRLADRFRWYYSLETGENGFENQFDLSKQLTANLHLGFRHEARADIPNADVGDYTLWRVLLGLDF